MSIRAEAIERIEQTKRSLQANMKSPNIEYMAFIGALVECNLLIDQYKSERNKDMMMHHQKMKNIIAKKFINYCLKNGYKYLK